MMTNFDRTEKSLLIGLPVLILMGFILPEWIVNYIHVSLGTGLVALGIMIQMRAGLVSFGQGLYFCIGGYTAGMAGKFLGITDIFLLLALGLFVSVSIAFFAGFLLRRYREIFFAMLSLALSMILFGYLSRMGTCWRHCKTCFVCGYLYTDYYLCDLTQSLSAWTNGIYRRSYS
jgi:branched-chain amino acid transport system permease protein